MNIHPRILVMLVLLAIYVIAAIAIAVSDKLTARKDRPTLTPADAPTTDGWRVTDAMRYMRENTPPAGWMSVPLDVVARPMTADEMVQGYRHLAVWEQRVRDQAADKGASDAWDTRVERAMRKLTAPTPTTCVVEYEEGNETVRWMDVHVAATGIRVGVECGTVTAYGHDGHDGAYVEILTGDEHRHAIATSNGARPTAHPLLTLERWQSRPTHSTGWAE